METVKHKATFGEFEIEMVFADGRIDFVWDPRVPLKDDFPGETSWLFWSRYREERAKFNAMVEAQLGVPVLVIDLV